MPPRSHKLLALSVCLLGWLACNGSSGTGGTGSTPGTAGTGSQTTGNAGGTGSGTAGVTAAGAAGSNGPGQAGATGSGTAGATGAAGSTTAGAAGATTAGTAGATGAAGAGAGTAGAGAAGTGAAGVGAAGTGAAGMTGADPCTTPPWRALKVTAPAAFHSHGNAAFDNRVAPLGKLVIDLGVSGAGNAPTWVVNRGYHGMGSAFGACAAPNLGAGRDAVGNCRLNQEWGSVKAGTIATVKALATSNPEEDWGYFLTQDGTGVRWSDVAFMGVSHGATTAAVIGHLGECVWRVVSSAGPRDNTCGQGPFTLPYSAANPPFDPNCPLSQIASWLDAPSKTPMNRFYVIDGVTDGEYGDIMFNVERTKYPGQPVQFDVTGAVLTGTNRFIAMGGGHLDFVNSAPNVKPLNTDAVLNIAFAIPLANQK